MYSDTKEKISLLQKKVDELEGRQLGQAELELRDEMESEIRRMKRELPMAPSSQPRPTASSNSTFRSIGEFAQSVAAAARPGAEVDQRLYGKRDISGLNETVPSEGGFLVQNDFGKELISSVYLTGKLAKLCKKIPISAASNSIKIRAIDETNRASGSRFGALQTYWLQEAGQKLGSHPKFRVIELNLKKLIGLCYTSDELLQDATALDAVIRDAFVSEFGFSLDDAIVNGTGAGQPLGILNSGSLVSVAKETGQKVATVVAENVIKMYSRLLPGSESTAVWLVNKNILPNLYTMSLAVGTGGVGIYMPANSLANQPYNTLMGCPVIPIEQAATLGTQGDIILADLTNGYILAEKGGIQQDISIHIRYIFDESVFRFVLRADGCPVLSAPIAPFKGAASTQSHFIALADRV